jgi:MOSC domain-containing protein YiiM
VRGTPQPSAGGRRGGSGLGTVVARIASVQVGVPRHIPVPAEWAAGPGTASLWTAIAKSPVRGPVAVRWTHLDGDAQADTRHHGGPDKAVHAHFAVHLAWWGERRGRPLLPGAIGENLTLTAAPGGPEPDEGAFCLGDVLAAGSAVLQVTQPRIPCHKQAAAVGLRDAPALAGRSGRTGLYLRVLVEGTLEEGDPVILLQRPHPEVTVADANRFIHGDRADAALRARLKACRGLGAELRRLLDRRAAG